MLRADQEQLRRAKVACPAEAYPQPPSLGPGWRRAPYSSSHRGPTAPRWRSPTSGGGGSRTSGSGAPPEVQLRHRTSGKRKAGVSQGSDILTLPGSQRGGTLSGGTFPNHVPPSPRLALLPCPFPTTFGSRVGGGGTIYLAAWARKENVEGENCPKPTKAASLAVPFWISSFLDQEKENHGWPTH